MRTVTVPLAEEPSNTILPAVDPFWIVPSSTALYVVEPAPGVALIARGVPLSGVVTPALDVEVMICPNAITFVGEAGAVRVKVVELVPEFDQYSVQLNW